MTNKSRNIEYTRRHEAKRQEAGDRRVMVWLSPEAQQALATSMELTGQSREDVMNRALIQLMHSEQVRRT